MRHPTPATGGFGGGFVPRTVKDGGPELKLQLVNLRIASTGMVRRSSCLFSGPNLGPARRRASSLCYWLQSGWSFRGCAELRRWVLSDHAEDEIPNYLGGRSSPDRLPDLRNQRPIPTESSPLPPDHGFGCDDGECLFPAGPEQRNSSRKTCRANIA